MMVLKRPFICDAGEDLLLHVHCLGLLGDRALGQYGSFTQTMILKRPFVSDTREASAYSLFRPSGRQSFNLM